MCSQQCKAVSTLVLTAVTLLLAACGGGSRSSEVTNTAPSQVALLSATSSAIGHLSVTWQAASDDTTPAAQLKYQLHASTDADYTPSSATQVFEGVQVLSSELGGLAPGARYYLRLVAQDAQGATTTSAVLSATVAKPMRPDTGITTSQCYAQAGSITLVSCADSAALALHSQQDGMITPGALGMSYGTVARSGGGHYDVTECMQDHITGLMWEGKPSSGPRAADLAYTAYGDGRSGDVSAYVTTVNAAGLCGYSDWRLPTPDELLGLVDYGVVFPAVPIQAAAFPNTLATSYWTGTTFASGTANVWRVSWVDGQTEVAYRTASSPVRLVRGTTAVPSPRYSYSADGSEVSDALTGLTWRRCAEGLSWSGSACTGGNATYTHEQALAWAQSQTGWRLPSVKELNSVVDLTHTVPAVDSAVFPNTPTVSFWTSTPYVSSSGFAWGVNFGNGFVQPYYRNDRYRVRLVR
jgi:hypothetical protein